MCLIFNGPLTRYDIDGADSLPSLSNYFVGQNAPGSYTNISFSDSQPYHDDGRKTYLVTKGASMTIYYDLVEKKKKLLITQLVDTNIFRKNLFVLKGSTWAIAHFPKKKENFLKLSATIQGKAYVVQIGS